MAEHVHACSVFFGFSLFDQLVMQDDDMGLHSTVMMH